MFVIAGVSGHTGSVVATTLLAAGKPVRVIVRDAAKGAEWKAKGAEVAVAQLDDRASLAAALKGATGAYLLSPPDFLPNLSDDWFLERHRQNKWVFVTGEHDICRSATEHMSRLFDYKRIPNSLHVWGHGSLHDWPEWVKMASVYLP